MLYVFLFGHTGGWNHLFQRIIFRILGYGNIFPVIDPNENIKTIQ